ncbi:MAG: hypothetical protein BIFFINMI_04062 [Phycisphaerae bacterium]|nr:hypothetical protein [Phycisphaerae bacterium]
MSEPSQDRTRRGVSRVTGCALTALFVIVLAAAPLLAQPATPSAPALTPEQIVQQQNAAAAQMQAAAEAKFRELQAAWLVTMARSLKDPPPSPLQAPPPTPAWKLQRRADLLTAALRIEENYPEANFGLYEIQSGQASADRARAEQLEVGVLQARKEGKPDIANDLAERAKRHRESAARLRLSAVNALAKYVAVRPTDVPAWSRLLSERMDLMDRVEDRIAWLTGELAALRKQQADHDAEQKKADAVTDGPKPYVTPAPPPEKFAEALTLLADCVARQRGPGGAPAAGVAATQPADESARSPEELLRQAIGLSPLYYPARARLADLKGDKRTAADDLELLLVTFRQSPLDMATVIAIGTMLKDQGIYSLTVDGQDVGAVGFEQYQIDLEKNLAGAAASPRGVQMELADTLARAGRGAEAAKLLGEVIKASESVLPLAGGGDPLAPLPQFDFPARVMLAGIYGELRSQAINDAGRQAYEAGMNEQIDAVLKYYAAHKDKPAMAENARALALVAWMDLRVRGLRDEALAMARLAAKADARDSIVRRSLGAALADGGKGKELDEAQVELGDLARAGEPWAMYYFAQAVAGQDKPGDAAKLFEALLKRHPGHPVSALAAAKLAAMGGPAAAAAADLRAASLKDQDAIRALLGRLPAALFQFYKTPGKFAPVEIRMLAGEQPYEPVTLAVRVRNDSNKENAAAGFPVSIGDGKMVVPFVLVSVAVQLPGEESARVFRDYYEVRLGGPLFLAPGDMQAVIRTIDVGPVWQLLRLTPQARSQISLQVIVNPAPAVGGGWTWGPGGYAIPLGFVREGFSVASTAVDELLLLSRQGSPDRRILANRILGSLLAEQQLAKAKRLSYRAAAVADYRLVNQLVAAATDATPEVRAFMTDAVYPAGLDRKLREAAVGLAADNNWLPRLLALRLIGDRLAASDAQLLRDAAAKDTDPLIRDFARTYVQQWEH